MRCLPLLFVVLVALASAAEVHSQDVPEGFVLGSNSGGPHPPQVAVSTSPLGYVSGDLSMAAWVRFTTDRTDPASVLFGVQNPGTDSLAEGIRFHFLHRPFGLRVGGAELSAERGVWYRVLYVRKDAEAKLVVAAPQPPVPGDDVVGSYDRFDGTWVVVPEIQDVGPTASPYSIEAIVRTNREECNGYVLGKALSQLEADSIGRPRFHAGALAFGLGMDGCAGGTDRRLRFQIRKQSGETLFIESREVLPVGEWVRIIVTDDGSELRMYMDGLQVAEGPSSTEPLFDSVGPITIGGLVTDGIAAEGQEFWNWDGGIALVRMYEEALNENQVAARADYGCAESPDAAFRACWDLGVTAPWEVKVATTTVDQVDSGMGLATFGGIQNLGADYGPGRWVDGTGLPADTYLADLMTFDGAWTDADIDSLLSGGAFPVTNRWPANEGHDRTAHDTSGQNHLGLGQWGEGFDVPEAWGGHNQPLLWRHTAVFTDPAFLIRSGTSYVDVPRDGPYWSTPKAADLDLDGDLDLIRMGENWTDCDRPLPGTGLLTMEAEGTSYASAWHSYGSRPHFLGDFALIHMNGDRLPDLVSGEHGIDDWCGEPGPLSVYLNESDEGGISFAPSESLSRTEPFYYHGMAFGDLDRDGWIDALAAGSGTQVLRNTGGAGFEDLTRQWLEAAYVSQQPELAPALQGGDVAMIDIDRDGILEIMVTHDGSGHSPPEEQIRDSILKWNEIAGHYERVPEAANWLHDYDPAFNDTPLRPRSWAADMDADGDQDLVLLESGAWFDRFPDKSAHLRVMENVNGILSERLDWRLPNNSPPADLADVNGDGYWDQVVWKDPYNEVWLFDPRSGWADATPFLPHQGFIIPVTLGDDANGPARVLYQAGPNCPPATSDLCRVEWFEMTATDRLNEFFPTTPVPVPDPPADFTLDSGGLHWTVATTVTCADLQFARDQAFADVFLEHQCFAGDTLSVNLPTEAFYVRGRSHRAARTSDWSAPFAAQGAVVAGPLANADAFDLVEDGSLVVGAGPGLLSNDSAYSGRALNVVLVDSTAHGDLSLASDGAFTYVPDDNYNGTDGFTYFATDGYDSTAVAQVTLRVAPVNDAPVVGAIIMPGPSETLNVSGDPADTISVEWPPATDVDGDALSYRWHLASTSAFADTVYSVAAGAATEVEVSVGELAAHITAQGVLEGSSVDYFHRIYANDADTTVAGPGSSVSVLRGAVTGTEDKPELPTEVMLLPAYPNPFNPQTTLGFGLPDAARVRLDVFDILGRRVRLLVDGIQPAGWHRVVLDAGGLATGSYVLRLDSDGTTLTRTITLLRE